MRIKEKPKDVRARDGEAPVALRILQVAHALSVPRSTVYSWVARGLLPTIRIGKVRLILRIDLEEFLATHKVPAVKEM